MYAGILVTVCVDMLLHLKKPDWQVYFVSVRWDLSI